MISNLIRGSLTAALLGAIIGTAAAQTYRNRLPTRPVSPPPATGSGLVTPSMGAQAMPNFANVTQAAPTTGVSPAFNPALSGFNPFSGFNPGVNPFNYPLVNPYNAGFNPFGVSPFMNPYGGFGVNPYFSPYNTGFFPGASPFGTPFNPYFGTGMYNPLLGY